MTNEKHRSGAIEPEDIPGFEEMAELIDRLDNALKEVNDLSDKLKQRGLNVGFDINLK